MPQSGMPIQGNILFKILDPIAESRGVDVMELPPLGETIDVDGLKAILESGSDVVVSFEYARCRVTIETTGAVMIEED